MSAEQSSGAPVQRFPSWSWPGWIGKIDYRMLHLENEPLPNPLMAETYVVTRTEKPIG